jgi:hypothetical protein
LVLQCLKEAGNLRGWPFHGRVPKGSKRETRRRWGRPPTGTWADSNCSVASPPLEEALFKTPRQIFIGRVGEIGQHL